MKTINLYGKESNISAWLKSNLGRYLVVDFDEDLKYIPYFDNVVFRGLRPIPLKNKRVFVWKGEELVDTKSEFVYCFYPRRFERHDCRSVNEEWCIDEWFCKPSDFFVSKDEKPISDLVFAFIRRGGKSFEKYLGVLK